MPVLRELTLVLDFMPEIDDELNFVCGSFILLLIESSSSRALFMLKLSLLSIRLIELLTLGPGSARTRGDPDCSLSPRSKFTFCFIVDSTSFIFVCDDEESLP